MSWFSLHRTLAKLANRISMCYFEWKIWWCFQTTPCCKPFLYKFLGKKLFLSEWKSVHIWCGHKDEGNASFNWKRRANRIKMKWDYLLWRGRKGNLHVLDITRTKQSRIVSYSVSAETHGNVLVPLLLLQPVGVHLDSRCTAIQSLRKNITALL